MASAYHRFGRATVIRLHRVESVMSNNNGSVGILAYGAYVPRLRLNKKVIVEANSWFNPVPGSISKGERAICNWDEDSVTMAVEAARDCLADQPKEIISSVQLASTSLPFDDRQNATIVREALNLGERMETLDITSSLRAGTSSLINLLSSKTEEPALFVSAENRNAKNASLQELRYGDGAAAFLVGRGQVVAEFLGSESTSIDFVDHFRGRNQSFDYEWEERWAREEGYGKIVPRTVTALLEKVDIAGGSIDHFIMPVASASVAVKTAKALQIPPQAVADNLQTVLGDCGAAHAPIMLAQALQRAEPGALILIVGWGQGCDALLFRATGLVTEYAPPMGVDGFLARRREENNYNRYLAFNRLVEQEQGIRAENDKSVALSALYRNRETVLGFVGGVCRGCGTRQFPKSNICVNPECGEIHSQDSVFFADVTGKMQSWTADSLVFSPDPPSYYGMVKFDGGGQLMADMTDMDPGVAETGMRVRMVFRIKSYDARRGYTRYFWKAVPA